MSETAVSILERLAFVFSFPAEEEILEVSGQDRVQAGVCFDGPMRGILWIELPQERLKELTSNMLGLAEGQISPELERDGLGEIINVICGNLLPRLAGETSIFTIGAPVFAAPGDGLPLIRPEGESVEAVLDLDGGVCRLNLHVEERILD